MELPTYGLSGSSPARYAEDFREILRAIDALRQTLADTDYPHGRDFQGDPDTYTEARNAYRAVLDTLRAWERAFEDLAFHAANHVKR